MGVVTHHLRPVKITIRSAWCKGCGICAALCPKQVLRISQLGKAEVEDSSRCTSCRMCESHCPDYAIDLGVLQDE